MGKTHSNVILLFVASAILSAFAYNLYILGDAERCTNDIVQKICYESKKTEYFASFMYVFFKRLKQLFLIWVMFKAFKSETVVDFLSIIFGVFIGMMVTSSVYLNGFNGLAVLIICFLPHYPVYIYLIKNLYNLNNYTYKDKSFWGYFLMTISVFCIGIVCECYFSKFFIKCFINI